MSVDNLNLAMRIIKLSLQGCISKCVNLNDSYLVQCTNSSGSELLLYAIS